MLTQLKFSGALDGALGVCMGAFTKCEAETGPGLRAAIKDALASLAFPVYFGVPAGHIKGNTALPFFGKAAVKANQLTVYLP